MSDWIGPLSLLVTLTGVVTTIVAAITAAWIGKQYVSHIEEVASSKARYEKVIGELEQSKQQDAARLLIAIKGIDSLFGLVMAGNRRTDLVSQKEILVTRHEWGGRVVPDEMRSSTIERMQKEIDRVSSECRAREHELYVLVAGGNNKGAYIRDLVETWGDRRTLAILEAISECPSQIWDKDLVVPAIYELRRRLRSNLEG
jgi:hypothetical protein